jgi:hypothetical protein
MREETTGCSLLRLPVDGDSTLLGELVTALVHDLPLHDAVAEIARAAHLHWDEVPLVSDPFVNHALRISDAQGWLLRDTLELDWLNSLRNVDSFLERVGRQGDVLRPGLQRAAHVSEDLIRAADNIRQAPEITYGQESHGLYPLAESARELDVTRPQREQIVESLSNLAADPKVATLMREHQERRVDIALASSAPLRLLPPTVTLAAGRTYYLFVRIGGDFFLSLFGERPPAIDPLLPDPPDRRGHPLEIVLFPIDFGLLSAGVQPVTLPLYGATPVVEFALRCPGVDAGEGLATARVCVYHDNHLVQSFLLSAEVTSQETWIGPGVGLRAELEFSRTERFENLERLGPRVASLAINHGGGATHRLMIKGDSDAQEFVFSEDMLSGDIERFRATLEEATAIGPDQPRFEKDPAPQSKEQAEADAYIRRLARDGAKLHEELRARSGDALFEALRSVAKERDKTIQIIRYDPNYALPWSAFYDFDLPAGDAPICRGMTERGDACDHGPMQALDLFCVYGFWGVRHRIEQFLVPPHGESSTPPVLAARTEAPTLVALGVNDTSTDELLRELKRIAPDFAEQVDAGSDILGVLWAKTTRPTFLVVVGRLDSGSDFPRIVLSPTQVLDGSSVNKRAWVEGRLKDPRPIVLLMACGSTATDLATHAGLSLAVSSAGAAAVVGTEASVFTGLVKDFVNEVMNQLWEGRCLGAAITAFRRSLLGKGNPLAFVFTAFGDADLTIVHQ